MANFSTRQGITPPPQPQTTEVSEATRNRLFNRLLEAIQVQFDTIPYARYPSTEYRSFLNRLCSDFLGESILTKMDPHDGAERISHLFQTLPYNRLYDLIEFILEFFPFMRDHKTIVTNSWNKIFRVEILAYRIVSDLVVPLQSEAETAAIESALRSPVEIARHCISRALKELSARSDADYNAVIRDVVDALEGFCKHHCGSNEPNLRAAIRKLADRKGVHPQLKEAMDKLSDFADSAGIRHPKPDTKQNPREVAVFVLTVCSAFISFIDASTLNSLRS
jgi:hypothetical protein